MLMLLLAVVGCDIPAVEELAWRDMAHPYSFSFVDWEVRNFFNKWVYLVTAGAGSAYEDYHRVVERYFGVPGEKALEDEVEYVLEGQITRALAEAGLAVRPLPGVELVLPPVDFELDSLPYLLVVSPRERIELADTVVLRQHLTLDQVTRLEAGVEGLGVSALVVRLGGISTYPAIVPEDTTLERCLVTAAHEWTHAYLFFFPLGRGYFDSYEMRTINETVADMVGDEIGSLVMDTYYPGLRAEGGGDVSAFHREMRAIRLAVDRYLAQGEVEEAERFMEERRQALAAMGYRIRKLNQAYFAFHGCYADTPASVSPVGEQLAALRARNGSLGEFLETVAQISRPEDLDRMAAGLTRP